MKNPASFHIVTTIRHASAVSRLPSQLWLGNPKSPAIWSSRP